jgi:hypothetical protein
MTIYFVRTHHHYAQYDDWYNLATLSGFETCMENELDVENPDHTYITNHFAALGLNGNDITAKAQIILWQTEYITPENYTKYSPNIKRFWHMDAWQAATLNHEYIPIGSHRDLGKVGISGAYKYDIALFAYASGRRAPHFQRMGELFDVTPNCWGEQRDRALRASRLMVHIHQHPDMPAIPGIRMALAAAYGLPVLCESVNKPGIYSGHMLFAPLHSILGQARMELNEPQRLADYAHRLNRLLCDEFTFKKVVEGNV